MKYTYMGNAGYINGLIKELKKNNIPFEWLQPNEEMSAATITSDVEPKEMVKHLDESVVRQTRILPIPKKVFRNNVLEDMLLAQNCELAYIRLNENDTKIIDSKELYPNKFTPEFTKKWFEELQKNEEKEHSTNEDIIQILNSTLDSLANLISAKDEETADFLHDSIEADIKSVIRRLNYQSKNK